MFQYVHIVKLKNFFLLGLWVLWPLVHLNLQSLKQPTMKPYHKISKQAIPLYKFMKRSQSQEQLDALHLALFAVLYALWISNGCINPFNTSRKTLMAFARIRSKSTYHIKISELTRWGFIRYVPSYHPVRGSAIYILV